jgi:DNA-binding NtrC family response regulator
MLALHTCRFPNSSLVSKAMVSSPAVIVLGAPHSGTDLAIEAAKELREYSPGAKILVLAGQSSEESAIDALRAGVHDYFRSPVSITEVVASVLRLLRPSRHNVRQIPEIVGNSDSMKRVKEVMHRVSPSDAPVLIEGETGTGKELIAQGIHALSRRSSRPLVASNCSAIPDTLIESELFGHDKGAFTGAVTSQHGLFRRGHTGTVFLDEIAEMSPLAQAKILRALESGEIQPLGAQQPVRVDIRVIAATHRDLRDLVSNSTFRRDLFFRLNVIPIHVPPLRERRGDIPELVQRFIEDLNERNNRAIEGASPGALKLLAEQDWPGNIRQLRNVVEAAFVVCAGPRITERDLLELHWHSANNSSSRTTTNSTRFLAEGDDSQIDSLLAALRSTHWNKSQAAHLLGCSRMTVYRKMSQYSLSPGDEGLTNGDAEVTDAVAR